MEYGESGYLYVGRNYWSRYYQEIGKQDYESRSLWHWCRNLPLDMHPCFPWKYFVKFLVFPMSLRFVKILILVCNLHSMKMRPLCQIVSFLRNNSLAVWKLQTDILAYSTHQFIMIFGDFFFQPTYFFRCFLQEGFLVL